MTIKQEVLENRLTHKPKGAQYQMNTITILILSWILIGGLYAGWNLRFPVYLSYTKKGMIFLIILSFFIGPILWIFDFFSRGHNTFIDYHGNRKKRKAWKHQYVQGEWWDNGKLD